MFCEKLRREIKDGSADTEALQRKQPSFRINEFDDEAMSFSVTAECTADEDANKRQRTTLE